MNPVTILAWMGVVLVGMILATIFGHIIFVTVVGAATIIKDYRSERRHKRANCGKVRCEFRDCQKYATRVTVGRSYFCDQHRPKYAGASSRPLDYTRKPMEDK